MTVLNSFDPQLETARLELRRGEALRWAGRPSPLRYILRMRTGFRETAVSRAVGGLLLLSLAGVVMFSIGGLPGLGEETGFGIAFVVILVGLIFYALSMLAAPLLALARAVRVVYVVTNLRVLIIEEGWQVRVTSFGPLALGGVRKKVRSDQSGDIEGLLLFGVEETGLYGIPQVAQVEALIQQIVEQV